MTEQKKRELVKCPWCKHKFKIVSSSSAKGFICPNCENESSLGSLQNPDHRPNAMKIAEASAIGATENVYRHSAAYTYLDNSTGRERIASGTLVRIGERLLLATVAHTKPKTLTSIDLVRRSRLLSSMSGNHVVRRVVDRQIDVACFELKADADSKIGIMPIGIERIHDSGYGQSWKTRLVGFPRDYINTKTRPKKAIYALSYGCEPIEPSRWASISNRALPLAPNVNVVVVYDSDTLSFGPAQPVPDGLPAPFGMSGGGLWQRSKQIEDGKLWIPDDLKLFAIQSSVLKNHPYLIAI